MIAFNYIELFKLLYIELLASKDAQKNSVGKKIISVFSFILRLGKEHSNSSLTVMRMFRNCYELLLYLYFE